MNLILNFILLVCGVIVANAESLPSFITPCSRSLTKEKLSECITAQAKLSQQKFAKGIPELNIEPLDPLSLENLSANTGTFTLKNTNVVVKGLRKVDIKEMNWDLENKVGFTKIIGNLTFTSDYETDGRVLLFPVNGNGIMLVKMCDTINQVLNANWRDLMGEVGPPYAKAIAEKVHYIINKLYATVPYDQLIIP